MISDWTIIVVALIAAASYLIPRMATLVVNMRQLHKLESAALAQQIAQSGFFPDVPEDTKTGTYV